MNAVELYRRIRGDDFLDTGHYRPQSLLSWLLFKGEVPIDEALLVEIAEMDPEWFNWLEWWVTEQLLPDEAVAMANKINEADRFLQSKRIELDRMYAQMVAPAFEQAFAAIKALEGKAE